MLLEIRISAPLMLQRCDWHWPQGPAHLSPSASPLQSSPEGGWQPSNKYHVSFVVTPFTERPNGSPGAGGPALLSTMPSANHSILTVEGWGPSPRAGVPNLAPVFFLGWGCAWCLGAEAEASFTKNPGKRAHEAASPSGPAPQQHCSAAQMHRHLSLCMLCRRLFLCCGGRPACAAT